MSWQQNLILAGASALAGAINSVAGGGTLVTFPALLWTGHSALIANATSTVALWPGSLSSLWGYRAEIGSSRTAIARLTPPSFIGGIIGALLLLKTPPGVFAALVPYLILLATLLFVAQEPLSRFLRVRAERSALRAGASDANAARAANEEAAANDETGRSNAAWTAIIAFQLLVGLYGGYFGAGIGILMLASLGLMGFRNIHRMNALKNINAGAINFVASALFIVKGLVDWRIAAIMAVGAIAGGYGGAGAARRIGQKNVRRLIIFIGLALALSLLIRR